jgi:CDP-diacylglycerol--serine O-phosphatidyltransferase
MTALGYIGASRYVVPSLFTVCSMGCALMSMQSTSLPADPAWLILCCVLLDKVDGTAARLLRAQTRVGVQLDSLADLLAFGVAPAHLFYRMASRGPIVFPGSDVLWAVIAVGYALATACRLHRFNQEAGGLQSRSFRGMPSTLSGAIFASYVVAFMQEGGVGVHAALTAMVLALSVAMNASYRSRKVTIPRRRTLLLLQSTFVVFIYYATLTRQYPELLFVGAMVALGISILGVESDPPEEATEAH